MRTAISICIYKNTNRGRDISTRKSLHRKGPTCRTHQYLLEKFNLKLLGLSSSHCTMWTPPTNLYILNNIRRALIPYVSPNHCNINRLNSTTERNSESLEFQSWANIIWALNFSIEYWTNEQVIKGSNKIHSAPCKGLQTCVFQLFYPQQNIFKNDVCICSFSLFIAIGFIFVSQCCNL